MGEVVIQPESREANVCGGQRITGDRPGRTEKLLHAHDGLEASDG